MVEFRYNVPNNFNQRDVYGKFLKLFKIKDVKSHHLAIEAAAGGRMFNVVVKNERVSKELIQNRAVQYNVTYIPLNVIDARCIPNEIV